MTKMLLVGVLCKYLHLRVLLLIFQWVGIILVDCDLPEMLNVGMMEQRFETLVSLIFQQGFPFDR